MWLCSSKVLFSKAGRGYSWLTTGLYPEPVSLCVCNPNQSACTFSNWRVSCRRGQWVAEHGPSRDPQRRCNHVKLLFANIGKFTEFNLSATPICGWKSTSVYFKILDYFWFQIWIVSGSFSNTWHSPTGTRGKEWTPKAAMSKYGIITRARRCQFPRLRGTEIHTLYETRTKSPTSPQGRMWSTCL